MKSLQLPFLLRAPGHVQRTWPHLEHLSELCHRVSLCALLESLSCSLAAAFLLLQGTRGSVPEPAASLRSVDANFCSFQGRSTFGSVSAFFNKLFDEVCLFVAFQLPALVFGPDVVSTDRCCFSQSVCRSCVLPWPLSCVRVKWGREAASLMWHTEHWHWQVCISAGGISTNFLGMKRRDLFVSTHLRSCWGFLTELSVWSFVLIS